MQREMETFYATFILVGMWTREAGEPPFHGSIAASSIWGAGEVNESTRKQLSDSANGRA